MGAFAAVKSGFGSLKSSVGQLASLNIDLMEKVAEKQLATMGYYTDMGFAQVKSAKSISSVSEVKGFATKSVESASAMMKKMVADGKEYVDMGGTYKDEVMGIIKSMKPAK